LLKEKGYSILKCNFNCSFGEIDIIAQKGDLTVFVEVKARTSKDYGYPSEFVDDKKRRNIKKCASYYMLQNNLNINEENVRFDVIAIENRDSVEWIENAF